ncbi:MAG: hypothetical protein JSW07_03410, partial [bacterium]
MQAKIRIMIISVFLSFLLIGALYAQWSNDPNVNTPICTDPGEQQKPIITSDGSGGAIIAWSDWRGQFQDVYVSRIDATGKVLWTPNGIRVSDPRANSQQPVIVGDNAGGVIVAWVEDSDIHCQKVDASGNLMWGNSGFSRYYTSRAVTNTMITTDGAGGAIIGWNDDKDFPNQILSFQHVNATGDTLWGQYGIFWNGYDFPFENPTMTSDGNGGAITTWIMGGSENSVIAQRIDAAGKILWDPNNLEKFNGAPICTNRTNPVNPQIISDGSQGANIVWGDRESGFFNKLYAQRVDESGIAQWDTNGVAVCAVSSDQYDHTICSDGNGGIVIAWEDDRNANDNIYAQRIDGNGNLLWSPEGKAITNTSNWDWQPAICEDRNGGAIITWIDSFNVIAQRVNMDGNIMWDANGVEISKGQFGNMDIYPAIVSDGLGGAIITWTDHRSDDRNPDIYAQRVDSQGYLGKDATSPTIEFTPIPEANENEPIIITATITDTLSGVKTSTLVYRTGGSRDSISLDLTNTSGNDYEVTIPGDQVTSKGIQYYIRVEDNSGNVARSEIYSIPVRIRNLVKETSQPAEVFQMISLPINPDNPAPENILADNLGNHDKKKWRLFQWSQPIEDYIEIGEDGFENFYPGNGFWLITKEAKTIDSGPGKTVDVHRPVVKVLHDQWNIISSPYNFVVDWADVIKLNCS